MRAALITVTNESLLARGNRPLRSHFQAMATTSEHGASPPGPPPPLALQGEAPAEVYKHIQAYTYEIPFLHTVACGF